MSAIFYKSATDGWRVGVAESFPNTSTVTVVDMATKLRETVRADDIFTPPESHAKLLRMGDDPQFVEADDAVHMTPAPVELPPLIDCLRRRHAVGNNALFLGDNVALVMGPAEQGEEGLATRAVTALQATGRAQVVVASGDRSLLTCASVGASICRRLGASAETVDRIRAAHLVMAAFTHTVDGHQKAVRRLEVCGNGDNFSFAQLQYSLFDHDFVASAPQFNFVALAFVIYAFNSEEKERCLIPRRQVEFAAQPPIGDADVIAQLRDKYFNLTRAMEVLGFEIEVQLTVFARVAAVLHLLDVTFSPEGEIQNLAALRNAARLIQTDFNALTKVLTDAASVRAAATLLYLSAFKYLARRVNAALNPDGLSAPTRVSVIGVPAPQLSDGPAPVSVRHVVLNTLVEDAHQCFFRSSEQEMVQWQREGFAVSDELQSVFDPVDNYSLLKVLKGKGGVIAAALLGDPAAMFEQLGKITRNSRCAFDPSLGVLTVRHSFGSVRYQFPTTAEQAASLNTVLHPRFAALRDYLIANTDVDTQEALCLVEQAEDRDEYAVAAAWRDLQPTLATLCGDVQTAMYWWVRVLDTSTGFNGQAIAEKMTAQLLHPVIELRSHLPRRYVACPPGYIASTFSKVLPRGVVATTDRDKAEIIAKTAGVPHCVGKDSILIEASGIGLLRDYVRARCHEAAAKLQGAARSMLAAWAVNDRVEAWARAVGQHERDQAEARRLHKWQVDNATLFRDQRLELQERENEARVALRDECWVAWVALQTEVQQSLEAIIQANVVRSMHEESRLITRSIDHCHKAAVQEITARIQQRLLLQGQHLDAVVDQQTRLDEASSRRMRKLEVVNDRVLQSRVAQEEARLELERRLLNKQTRQQRVAAQREEKREQLRQEMWMRQERDHAARVRMDKTREVISNRMREGIVMDDIERTLAKRLQAEVVERQRRAKAEKEAELRARREAREAQLLQQQKHHARAVLRREAQMQREVERSKSEKRRQEMAIWASQERERLAAERLRQEEERRNKTLTRALLRAHNMLNTPIVYEQSLRGASVLSGSPSSGAAGASAAAAKRVDPATAQGFVMAGDKTTFPRLLDGETWDGILAYHKARREGTIETALAASASRSQPRERSASPRSVFSL